MPEIQASNQAIPYDHDALVRIVKERRTIHDFKPVKPNRDAILSAIDTACWAPNHKHTRPWRFYLLEDEPARKIIARYKELVREKRGEETARIKSVRWDATPAWMVITSARSEDAFLDREDYAATCCLVQNLSLLLWAQGIGMKWSTGAVVQSTEFFEITGIDSEKEFVVGLFGYGYPAAIPAAKREPLPDRIRIVR